MSEIDRVTEIKDRAGTGAPNFTFGVKFAGSDSGINPHTHTEGANEPGSPNNGDTWWDSANDLYKVYMDNAWKDWLGTSAPSFAYGGDRGISGGGKNNSNYQNSNIIEYWDMTSAGNSSDFGDLTRSTAYHCGACSSTTRGLFFGGDTVDVIDYIPITGNATDFGDLLATVDYIDSSSNGTRAVTYGGDAGGTTPQNVMQYVTIANTGNATDFGDMHGARKGVGAAGSATRGLYGGGLASGAQTADDTIQYITYDTTGNSTDFGNLTVGRRQGTATSNLVRAVWTGGYNDGVGYSDVIDYITIANTGNATDFGNLLAAGESTNIGATCNGTVGHITASGTSKAIQQITIANTGNATDFGDLTGNTNGVYGNDCCSGAAS